LVQRVDWSAEVAPSAVRHGQPAYNQRVHAIQHPEPVKKTESCDKSQHSKYGFWRLAVALTLFERRVNQPPKAGVNVARRVGGA
jgi:hypothetical protein